MILLGVNVDHVATLRQARYRDESTTHGGFVEPDPAALAWLAEDAGANGITMHVREDRRHVQVLAGIVVNLFNGLAEVDVIGDLVTIVMISDVI